MYIIKNGTVHVGDGTILSGHDILVQDGKIREVAPKIDKEGAKLLDASGRHVFPGFIDPASSIGALGLPTSYQDNNERSSPVTAQMNIRYSMDPDELSRQEFYKSGITAVGLAPGNLNVIGGQMAVFKTAPMRYRDRLVKEHAGLKCSVTADVVKAYGSKDKLPMTRMGIFHLLEESVKAAKEAKPGDRTRGQKVIAAALDGEMPFFISAETKGEIDGLMHLFGDIPSSINLIDGYTFGENLEAMLKKKVGLVLGNINYMSQVKKHHMDLSLLKELDDGGCRIAFTNTTRGSSDGREILLWTAIDVYRAGVDAERVVRMITLNPAVMLGVEDRLGSLEVGKDADLSIYTGHPVTTYAARVEHSMINGEVVF